MQRENEDDSPNFQRLGSNGISINLVRHFLNDPSVSKKKRVNGNTIHPCFIICI